MTAAASGLARGPDTRRSDPVRSHRFEARSVLDTTELRWFLCGPLPPEILRWFGGPADTLVSRCDSYLLNDRHDVGVKRRFGATLELKARQSLDGWIDLGEGLCGLPEVWRRWSPADGLVSDRSDGRWLDVEKLIVKRRFLLDGTEVAYSPDVPVGPGCDIEVTDLTVGTAREWTFSFAAFGPAATRRDALLASWRSLRDGRSCPEPLTHLDDRAMGYPEWLALMVSSAAGSKGQNDDVRSPVRTSRC